MHFLAQRAKTANISGLSAGVGHGVTGTKQCEEKSTTMQPMVGGKLSKSEESYPNARKTRAPESVQFKEK